MVDNARRPEGGEKAKQPTHKSREWNLSRRGLLGAGALLGLAATARPTERAFAWSSWTNATSGMLKKIGMGDCVHEDLVQISYARIVRKYEGKTSPESLLNPWAGMIDASKRQYATIAGDKVYAGKDKTFESADKLAELLYRENLAYLRIGSFWNDAAANQLKDFTYSCARPNNIPKFSGGAYQGAWDVGAHIRETSVANKDPIMTRGLDALVQFTMNDRNNFIHGMLTSQADLSKHLTQEEVKRYALQWLSVAYEYARTGKVTATSDVTQEQAQQIFNGFIDTYAQLADENNTDEGNAKKWNELTEDEKYGMCVSLQVSSSEASITLPKRRLRLRALGMMCHTLEDFWCPAHTCRAYRTIDGKKYPILAFSNYKLQNGDKAPMFGYHIPFDRYAISDVNNSTANWREAFTRGIPKTAYVGTETLENARSYSMNDIENAHTLFNTLGMNETIECITKLFDFMYQGTAWDDGVRKWIDEEVMPTYFNNGDSYICDAGRRSLHTPTYLMAPIQAMKRAYKKSGLSENYEESLGRAQSYDDWQRGAHLFYSGKYNTSKAKTIPSSGEDDPFTPDTTGESLLEALVDTLYKGYSSLKTEKEAYDLLAKIGANGCYGMVTALGRVSGMLQEFSIELTGKLRADDDAYMKKISELRAFYGAGLRGGLKLATQSSKAPGLLTAGVAYADEGSTGGGDFFTTSNMALEDYVSYEDGSYSIAVRDMGSLDTMVMFVPADTPGKEKLNEGVANLTISYTADTEFRDDPDCRYIVSEIDASEMQEGVFLVTGTVKSVSDDKKSLVLDLNGTSTFDLDIREGVDVPPLGAYICARYSFGKANLELVDYDDLDEVGEQIKENGQKTVEYPVAKVVGSRLWLLVNESSSEDDSYAVNYLQVEYRSADVRAIPQEGYKALVVYHDEAYGDVTDVDESALIASGIAAGAPIVTTQDGEEGSTGGGEFDSANTPGYLELDEDYGKLNYGNEVYHIADVIMGLPEVASDDDLALMYGGYYDEKSAIEVETEYHYYSNGDGTHWKFSSNPSNATEENCTYDSTGTCTLCGYVKSSGEDTPTPAAARKSQTLKIDTTMKRVKAKRLKKQPRFTSKVKVTGAKTKVTYKRLQKGSSPRLTINPKTGKIKVKRGTPAGVYRIKIKATAAKTKKFKAASKVASIKVKVI